MALWFSLSLLANSFLSGTYLPLSPATSPRRGTQTRIDIVVESLAHRRYTVVRSTQPLLQENAKKMTDFLNLDSRTSKLQKEQQKRREQARVRIQREKRSKELAARDRAKVEEQIKARKIEQQKKEEEVC